MSEQWQIEAQELLEGVGNCQQHDSDQDVAFPQIGFAGETRHEHHEQNAGGHVQQVGDQGEADQRAHDQRRILDAQVHAHRRHETGAHDRQQADEAHDATDAEGEQAGACVGESADLIPSRADPEDQCNRDQEQASQEVLIVHDETVEKRKR